MPRHASGSRAPVPTRRSLPPFPYRVAVADLTVDGPSRVARLLGPHVDLITVRSAGDSRAVLDRRLDLFVLEHGLPWGDTLALIRDAREAVAPLPLLVLTDGGDERLAVAALQAGACDYVRKSADDARVQMALFDAVSPWNSAAADDPNGVPAVLDAAGVGFLRVDPDGRVVDASPALARSIGAASVDVLAHATVANFTSDEADRHRWARILQRDGRLHQAVGHLKRLDGTTLIGELDARAVTHANGQLLYYECHVRDVTDRERLRERSAFQATLLDDVRHPVVALDPDLRISYWNACAERFYGWPAAQVLGRALGEVLVPADAPHLVDDVRARLDAAGTLDMVSDDLAADGSRRPTHKWASAVYGEAGARVGTVLVSVDVAELHERERQIHAALADRESLLREVHHRVKNNLQVVSSLLSLQASQLGRADLLAGVHACQVRLRAMGTIHELLYRAPRLDAIEVAAFFAGLVARSPGGGDGMSAVTLGDVAPAAIGGDLASDLGLLLTELRLSWGHLTGPGAPPPLRVDFEALQDGDYVVTVSEAPGRPVRGDAPPASSLADGLVLSLASEARAVLSCADTPLRLVRIRVAGEVRR